MPEPNRAGSGLNRLKRINTGLSGGQPTPSHPQRLSVQTAIEFPENAVENHEQPG